MNKKKPKGGASPSPPSPPLRPVSISCSVDLYLEKPKNGFGQVEGRRRKKQQGVRAAASPPPPSPAVSMRSGAPPPASISSSLIPSRSLLAWQRRLVTYPVARVSCGRGRDRLRGVQRTNDQLPASYLVQLSVSHIGQRAAESLFPTPEIEMGSSALCRSYQVSSTPRLGCMKFPS